MSTIESHSPTNISETVRDRALVAKDHQQEMPAYGESNGHVTDDVTWPPKRYVRYGVGVIALAGSPLISLISYNNTLISLR